MHTLYSELQVASIDVHVCVCVVRVECMCVQGLNGDMGMKGMKGDPGMDGQMGVQVSDTMLGLLTTLLGSHFSQLQNRCACTYTFTVMNCTVYF